MRARTRLVSFGVGWPLVVRDLRWVFLGVQQWQAPPDAQPQPPGDDEVSMWRKLSSRDAPSLSTSGLTDPAAGNATSVPGACWTGKPLGNAALSKPNLIPGCGTREQKDLICQLTSYGVALRKTQTFLSGRRRRVGLALADALDVDLLGFAQLATVLALSDRPALLLDFEEGAVKVFAGGRPVALDAGFAVVAAA